MSNARIQSAPRTAMELAWLKAAQRLATQKPKQPKPKPRKCLGDPGECDHNGACMYACGVPVCPDCGIDGNYMRHKPSETCECHDCHIARTRGVKGHSHALYTDADKNRPDVICDRNGQVVLALCKVCGKGEAELLDHPECPDTRGVNACDRCGGAGTAVSFGGGQQDPCPKCAAGVKGLDDAQS